MNKILKRVATVVSLLALVVFFASPAAVLAQATKDDICEGLDLTGTTGCDQNSTDAANTAVGGIVETVINILSLVVGVIAVIMIIVGGLKYITSSGDSNNVNSAKNTILYAVVGLVVVALAQIIVRFVLGKV